MKILKKLDFVNLILYNIIKETNNKHMILKLKLMFLNRGWRVLK